jgi:hypothetical protein
MSIRAVITQRSCLSKDGIWISRNSSSTAIMKSIWGGAKLCVNASAPVRISKKIRQNAKSHLSDAAKSHWDHRALVLSHAAGAAVEIPDSDVLVPVQQNVYRFEISVCKTKGMRLKRL